MDDTTLGGLKLQAYVIMKILKYCTGSSATSYQCKFAVQQVFVNRNIDSLEELGGAIKETTQFSSIRGMFSSVHADLAAEGIIGVKVGEKGLYFVTKSETGGANFNWKTHLQFF